MQSKLEAPGGANLLKLIGYVFIQEAQQHLGRWWGIQGFFAEVREKFHNASESVGIITSAARLAIAQRQLARDPESGAPPLSDEERQHWEEKAIQTGLNTFWRLGKMDIEKTVRSVCETVLRDPTLSDTTRKQRAKGLEEIGMYFEAAAAEAGVPPSRPGQAPGASRQHASSSRDIDVNSFFYVPHDGPKDAGATPSPTPPPSR